MNTWDPANLDWAPLEQFARLFPAVRPDEFMWMGWTGRVQLYKHCATRMYLNLDKAGHAYRFEPPGSWVLLPTPQAAIAALELDHPCNYFRDEAP